MGLEGNTDGAGGVSRARSRDVVFRMNGSLMDMEDLGCPGEWQADMQAGIDEIRRLRTALIRLADEPFSDIGSVRAFAASKLGRRGDNAP